MKLESVKVKQVEIPLKKPFKTALREVKVLTTNIVEITADTGETGFGEASPTAVITGDTLGSAKEAVEDYIFPHIKGMDIEDYEDIMININKAMIKNSSPKAAVDIAVHDLFGQHFKMPLHKFFGGAKSAVESDITVSVKEPESMAKDAVEYVKAGYNVLKIKVGLGSSMDIKRVKAIRDAIGYDIKLRLDANQGWNAKEAVRSIRKLEDMGFDIELVEQPVPYWDLDGLKYVRDNVEIPIMADEALFSPFDAVRILSTHAADILNIKLMKCGGLYNAVKINNIAESFGVNCMLGCMMESKVGITAAANFAAGKLNINRADLDAADLMAEDPVDGGVKVVKNKLLLNDGYGLGIKGIKY